MVESAARTGALADIAAAQRPALSLRARPGRGYLNLRGAPDDATFTAAVREATGLDLPITPNTAVHGDAISLVWLGPDEWLTITRPGQQRSLEAALDAATANAIAAVTDITSGVTAIELAGSAASGLLARGCCLDLHPRMFAPGHCAQTLLAKASVTVLQIDAAPTFELLVRRSFAEYLWRWLADAAAAAGAGLAV